MEESPTQLFLNRDLYVRKTGSLKSGGGVVTDEFYNNSLVHTRTNVGR